MEPGWVGLADAVRALRAELAEAMIAAEGERVRFDLGSVEMEFLLEVRKEASGTAGVRFWVVDVGGGGSVASGTTHRVKLALTPKDVVTGTAPEISDEE